VEILTTQNRNARRRAFLKIMQSDLFMKMKRLFFLAAAFAVCLPLAAQEDAVKIDPELKDYKPVSGISGNLNSIVRTHSTTS
jgi:hypothetical protein